MASLQQSHQTGGLMRYQVEIISLDANVEEAVVLKVKEHTLECFIRYDGLYPEVGCIYEASLDISDIEDQLKLGLADEAVPDVEHTGRGFRYRITGRLIGGVLNSVVAFEEDAFRYDYPNLEGRFVCVEIQRLD